MRRQRDPAGQRVAGVGIDPHVATHQRVEDVVVTVDRLPADAGQEVRDDDAVVLCQVLERGARHDQRECKYTQPVRLGGVRPPANEVASGTARCQPVAQGHEELRPLAARLVGDDQVAEHPVQFAAQATDEGGQAPARFKLAARRDRRPSGEDVRVGALKAVERDLQPQVQQAGRRGNRQAASVAGSIGDDHSCPLPHLELRQLSGRGPTMGVLP